MAEGTYENECERADLLGVKPPNHDSWKESERVRKENELAEQMTEINIQDEQINENTSKMDDITNILSITQMRLNKFKKACGSLTNLLKIRGGDDQETDDLNKSVNEMVSNEGAASNSGPKDIPSKMTSQLDKLDTILTKTDNAHAGLVHQNKQMKSFLQ